MPDDADASDPAAGTRSRRAGRALPPEAVAGLREAFADEVAARLPRLLALLDSPSPVPGNGSSLALRDAHTLGSSAVVVGEPDASRAARALEAELSADAPDADRLRALVRELADRLGAWLPAGTRPA